MQLPKQVKSIALAGGTLAVALGIGAFMQSAKPTETTPPVEVSAITQTSSAVVPPSLPTDAVAPVALPEARIELAAVVEDGANPNLPAEAQAEGFACAIDMIAETTAGAQVDLTITSPCNASERVTIHHNGLMFTDVMQPDGTLKLRIPALAETATFIAAFANGDGAVATADVGSLAFYDRVTVQWKGEAGLQLHAREFGAEYFGDGHIWSQASGDLAQAARGESGFLTRLGRADAPDALMAEIYSFPTGTAARGGDIAVTVEAEITEANCDTTVEAQTLEIRGEDGLRVRDMTLSIPGCDSVGDFLVLNNLVEDLTIASN